MNRPRLIIFLSLFIAAVALAFAMPRSAKFGYDYQKGKEWKYETLFAQFDFPIIKTEEQIAAERNSISEAVVPYYRFSSEIATRNIKAAAELDLGSLKSPVLSTLQSIYDKGVVSDEGIHTTDYRTVDDVIYIQRDKRAVKYPSTEVYKLSEARERLLSEVERLSSSESVDSVLRSVRVYDLVVPNLLFDRQTTDLVNAEVSSVVSPTMGYVSAGQLIVSNGEIITSEIEQMLDSYRKEYESAVGYDGPRFLLWLGDFLMAIALVSVLFFAIYLTKPKILYDIRFYYILLIYLIFAIVPLVISRFREDLLYIVPFTLSALYLQAFFRPKLLIPVYMASLLPLLVFTNNGMVLFVMYLVAGPVSVYAFNFLGRGWRQFIVALINFAVLAMVYMAFHWLNIVNADVVRILVYLFVASLLQFPLYSFVSLFEKIFNLVSNSRLAELCDTSNPLIRQLEQKAPGTFQHSLQVMSMADYVSRKIDANSFLVRAGALYHDIGKMVNPQCFVENESLVHLDEKNRYHYGLTPLQSARDILKHVPDGYEIAHQNHIPEKVCEFIITHHGTSTVSYFYNKYLDAGGSPDDKPSFRYDGRKPFSKEQVILMLCDSIEAASRTLTEHTPEAYSEFVEGIVAGKEAEGQFSDADISIRDLGILKAELKKYLGQIHHERIAYPNRNKNK